MDFKTKEILNISVFKCLGKKKEYRIYRKDIPTNLYKVLDCLIKEYISQLDIELSEETASFKVYHKLGHTRILSTDKAVTFAGYSNLILEEYRKKEDKYITCDIDNDRLLNPVISKYFANNAKELREDIEALDNIGIVPDSIKFEGEIIEKYTKLYEEYGIIGKCNIPGTIIKLLNDLSCKEYKLENLVKMDIERRDRIRYIKFKFEEYSLSFSYVEGDNFVSMYECKNIGENVGFEEVSFYDGRNDNVVSISTTIVKTFMKFFIDDRSVFDDLIKRIVTD